jgi:hypothetical protein
VLYVFGVFGVLVWVWRCLAELRAVQASDRARDVEDAEVAWLWDVYLLDAYTGAER